MNQFEQNKQSINKTIKIGLIVFGVVAVILIAYSIIKNNTYETDKPSIEYEVISSQEYARNGKKCMAYRVYVPSKPSNDDARGIFERVTKDSYYLHTVWFYRSKSKASGSDAADWTMEEVSKGVIPYIK